VTCDDVRATVLDAVFKQRAPTDHAVLAHIASCSACHTASIEYGQLWTEMGALTTRSPAPDAREQFRRRLAAERIRFPRPPAARTSLAWVGGAAAAALVLAIAGYAIGTRHASVPGGVASAAITSEPAFLLLLHEDSTFRRGEPPATRAALAAEYTRWADALPSGTYIRSAPLANEPGVWLGPPHEPIGPGDFVDGYFLIHARNMAAAQQIAATCPHIKHGGRIEIHEIDRKIDTESP